MSVAHGSERTTRAHVGWRHRWHSSDERDRSGEIPSPRGGLLADECCHSGRVPGGDPGRTSHAHDVVRGHALESASCAIATASSVGVRASPEQRGQPVEGRQVVADKYRNVPNIAESHGASGAALRAERRRHMRTLFQRRSMSSVAVELPIRPSLSCSSASPSPTPVLDARQLLTTAIQSSPGSRTSCTVRSKLTKVHSSNERVLNPPLAKSAAANARWTGVISRPAIVGSSNFTQCTCTGESEPLMRCRRAAIPWLTKLGYPIL
jgi:hypothetical protein